MGPTDIWEALGCVPQIVVTDNNDVTILTDGAEEATKIVG